MSQLAWSAGPTPTAILLEQAALPPPPGVVPHVTNHSENQNWFYVCVVICGTIPGVLLLLRLYTQLRITKQMGLTDVVVTTAYLFFISLLVVGRLVLAEGAGVHQWNLQLKHFIKMQFWFYINEILYAPTIFFVKAAILLQYSRILAPHRSMNPILWWAARAIIALTLVYYIISTSITIFACSPLEKIWNPLVTEGHCLDNNIAVIFTCLFNIVSDITILVLPAKAVWRLQIPRRKKVGIVMLFAIGVLACVANIMIVYYASQMGSANSDISFNAAGMGLWSFVEICFGIVVTCTLALPRLVEGRIQRLWNLLGSFERPWVSLQTLVFGTRNASVVNRTQNERGTKAQNYSDANVPFVDRGPV